MEPDDVRFAIRRVVVLGIARGRLNIRFGHCTSCLFDNSSVKLCKHDTPLLFAPSGANHEQGLGLDRVCEAQRSNESPSGAFKRQSGLAQARWRGVAPTSSVGFAIKGIMDCSERQDGFVKFIAIKL